MQTHIADFFSAWSLAEAGERTAAIAAATSPDVTYADPRTSGVLGGSEAISDYVGMFAQAAPNAKVVVIKSSETQKATLATIAFRMADGMEQLGQYFIETEAGGRIRRMVGFVGTGAPE